MRWKYPAACVTFSARKSKSWAKLSLPQFLTLELTSNTADVFWEWHILVADFLTWHFFCFCEEKKWTTKLFVLPIKEVSQTQYCLESTINTMGSSPLDHLHCNFTLILGSLYKTWKLQYPKLNSDVVRLWDQPSNFRKSGELVHTIDITTHDNTKLQTLQNISTHITHYFPACRKVQTF